MLFRKKSTESTTPASESLTDAEQPLAHDPSGRKGRPTPKRKVAQEANRRPLVPADRKAAARAARAKDRELRDRQYQAMQTGEERYLPARDKGPVKRYVRAFVDARWNIAEFFMPAAFVVIAATMLFARYSPTLGVYLMLSPYVLLIVAIADSTVMWRRLRAQLNDKFGEVPSGSMWYAVMRSFQLRRLRMPRPMEPKHGVYPS